MMKYISHQVTWHFLRPVVKRMTLTSFFCSASILTEMLVFLVKWVGNAHRKVWPQNAARHSKPRTLYTNTKDIPPYIFNGRAETALLAYRPIHKWLISVGFLSRAIRPKRRLAENSASAKGNLWIKGTRKEFQGLYGIYRAFQVPLKAKTKGKRE